MAVAAAVEKPRIEELEKRMLSELLEALVKRAEEVAEEGESRVCSFVCSLADVLQSEPYYGHVFADLCGRCHELMHNIRAYAHRFAEERRPERLHVKEIADLVLRLNYVLRGSPSA